METLPRKRILAILILTFAVIVMLVLGLTFTLLYRTAYEKEVAELLQLTESRARMIEAVARLDRVHSQKMHPQGSFGATLSQVEEALGSQKLLEGSEEIVLGRKKGDVIEFVLIRTALDEKGLPKPVTYPRQHGARAMPMRRALEGQTGVDRLLDYRGVEVLAAYAPIPTLGLGLVHKIDVDDVIGPFIRSGMVAGLIGLAAVVLGSLLFLRISSPLVRRLEENEQRYASLINAIPAGVYEADAEGHCLFVSRRWSEITGIAQAQALSNGWAATLHPDDKARVFREWTTAAQTGVTFESEYRFAPPGQAPRWVLGQAIPQKSADGLTTLGYLGVITDITERHQLDTERRLMKDAIDTSINAVAISGLDGNLTYINAAFLKTWGYDQPDEVIGRPAVTFWENQDDPQHVIDTLTAHGNWKGEMLAQRKDGKTLLVQVSAHLVRDQQGQPTGMMAAFADITALRAAEQSVQTSLARLNEAQRIAQVGSWDLDLVSGHLLWSDEIFRLFEIDKEKFDATYEAFLNAIHPDDRDAVSRAYTASLTNKAPYEIAHRLKMPDGRIKHVHERCESYFDAQGKPVRSVGTVQDITVRVQTEEKERRTRELLQAVIDSTPDWIYVKDDQHRFLMVNRSFAKACNQEPQSMIGKSDLVFWPEELCLGNPEKGVRGAHADDLDAIGGRTIRNPNDIATLADGSPHVFDTLKAPLRDAQGKPYGVLCYSRDVTERRMAERALEELNQQLEQRIARRTLELTEERNFVETVINTAGALVVVLNNDGQILRFNRACETTTGYLAEDVLGRFFWDVFLLPEEKDEVTALFTNLSHTNQIVHHENYWRTRSGGSRLISWANSTIAGDNGQVKYVIATGIDITERKLAEIDMMHAKEEAEQASLAKSEFLARMSHELRTPMNAILGFGQVLELESINASQKEYVGEILHAGHHLLDLINELLDLSRIEAGRLNISIEPVDLSQITGDAAALIKELLDKHKITLHSNLEHCAKYRVMADATRLKQIVINLLSNAAKYNRPGGRILIDCHPRGNDHLRLYVTDTGYGIAPEKQAQLFRPFERLGAEFGETEGTGIGLALSHRLAELMGATLGVDSTPGEGTTFWIDLRQVLMPHPAEAEISALGPAASPLPLLQGMKVLYVEDNPANLRLMQRVFANYPHITFLSAVTGEIGLDLARQHMPDLILMDIHLPGMDGYEALTHLKKRKDTRQIPVIALSADAMPSDIERGLQAGFFRYLSKPINIKQLMETLEETLTLTH